MPNNAKFDIGFEPHVLATQIGNQWEGWDSARSGWKERYKEVLEYVYATDTTTTTNNSNPWSHTTHIPKLTQIYDNLGSQYHEALFGSDDWMDWLAAAPGAGIMEKRKAILAYLRTKHEQSGFVSQMDELIDDWILSGNCFCMLIYVDETSQFGGEELSQYTGPRLVRISPLDIVFDVTATSFRNSPKIIRTVMSLGDLAAEVEDRADHGYDPAIVSEILDVRHRVGQAAQEDVIKTVQRQYDGFSSSYGYYTSGMVEKLEFFGDIVDENGTLHRNQHIVIVDRTHVLRQGAVENYYGSGHVYHSGWRKRKDNLWAMGPLENLLGMQYKINHLENARADAFDKMLTPDRVISGQVEEEEDGAVTTYYMDDAQGSVHNLSPDAQILNADFQIQRMELQMEAYAGAPSEAMGIRTPGEKTAFEVQELATAAHRLFMKRIGQFSREYLELILNGELEVSVRNIRAGDVAYVLDDDFGVRDFLNITPEDLSTRGVLRAMGARHYAIRSKKIQELQSFQNVLQGDQAIAVHFPAERRARAWAKLISPDPTELFVKFGQIAENVEGEKAGIAAQNMVDEFSAAADEALGLDGDVNEG